MTGTYANQQWGRSSVPVVSEILAAVRKFREEFPDPAIVELRVGRGAWERLREVPSTDIPIGWNTVSVHVVNALDPDMVVPILLVNGERVPGKAFRIPSPPSPASAKGER